jgi:hypothetical protein
MLGGVELALTVLRISFTYFFRIAGLICIALRCLFFLCLGDPQNSTRFFGEELIRVLFVEEGKRVLLGGSF